MADSQPGVSIVPSPGSSAVITALTISGLATEKFTYLGFLPRKVNSRRRFLETVVNGYGTIIVLESPHRLLASLNDMFLILGDRKIAVCRELTKIHEEVFRGSISQAIEYFAEPRGEFTLVIDGSRERNKPQLTEDVERQLHQMYLSGVTAKDAIARTAGETGLSKKELYRAWLKLR